MALKVGFSKNSRSGAQCNAVTSNISGLFVFSFFFFVQKVMVNSNSDGGSEGSGGEEGSAVGSARH